MRIKMILGQPQRGRTLTATQEESGWTGRPQTLRSLFHCGLRRPTNPSARVNSIAKHTHTDARVAPQKSVYTHWGLYATKTEVYVTEWTERLPQSGTEGVNYRGTGSLLEDLGAIRTPPGASVDVHSQLNYA